MNAAALMTPRPITLAPDERLDIARALMLACRFRHLPVTEGHRVVGLVSLRDLVGVDDPREREARSVMQAPVETIAPEHDAVRAARTLLGRRISCLPVVEGGRIAGIVTTTDFLREAIPRLRRQEPPATVARLMTPGPVTTVAPSELLDLASSIMRGERVRHLPVLDGTRLVGMLSDHDLLQALGGLQASPAERLRRASALTVAEVMTTRVITTTTETRAADAAELLFQRRFGALPVVRAGRLVGMLTVSDYLADFLAAHERGAHLTP